MYKENYERYRRKNYEFKINGLPLVKKDEKKIIKLASRIENGKSIAKKLRKTDCNTPFMLLATITRRKENEEKTITLLHHAISHKNAKAVKNILEEAQERKLLKEVLNEKMVIKSSGESVEQYTPFFHAKLCENSEVIDEILRMAGNEKILEDIFNENEQRLLSNVEQETAIGENSSTLPYIDADPEESLEVKEHTHTEASTKLYKHVDKDINIPQPVDENRQEVQNSSIKAVEPTPQLVVENRKKTSVKTVEPTPKPVVKNRAQNPSIKNIIEPIHISQPLAEDKEENQSDSIETTIESTSINSETNKQEQNVFDSISSTEIEPCFDSESSTENSESEKPPKKLSKPIIAGIVGVVLLANCVTLYIMKMPVAAAVLGIAVLTACIGFMLYTLLKPSTTFTEVENVNQPILLESSSAHNKHQSLH